MFKKTISILLAITFCFGVFTGCSKSEKSEITSTEKVLNNEKNTSTQGKHYPLKLEIYDDKGKKMEQIIDKKPERIVVLGQGFAEWMIGLGEADRIVGLAYLDNSFSKDEEKIKELPIITDMWPSKESVLELKPDLIISMSSAFQKDRLGDMEFWNERGIPVVTGINYTIGRTVDTFFEDISNLGKVLDVQKEANKFIEEQQNQINEIKEKGKIVKEKPKVLLLGNSGETTYYYGPSLCLIDEMIEDAGGEFVKISEETYVDMSEESILSVNPDKIVITGFQKSDSEALMDKYLKNPKLKNATAIKNKDIKVVEYTTAVRGSFKLSEMYKEVAEFVNPEIYKGE